MTDFRGTPAQGAGGTGIEFNTFLSSGDVVVDNVSLVTVPEPTGALAAWIGAGIVLATRRR